jgi:C4-dicarboxylate-specific signal transduction histidine kinase
MSRCRGIRWHLSQVLLVSMVPSGLLAGALLHLHGASTTDRSAGGLGVGLTLVQRLVELHGGEVVAHSNGRGMGATFTVRFPALEPPARRDQQLEVAS